MGVVAMEVAAVGAAAAGADIMEVIREVTMGAVGAMGVWGVIIIDISFLESSVTAMVTISTEVAAIHAIQG
jgi:hypothetical protein